jgi:hypothetical protein
MTGSDPVTSARYVWTVRKLVSFAGVLTFVYIAAIGLALPNWPGAPTAQAVEAYVFFPFVFLMLGVAACAVVVAPIAWLIQRPHRRAWLLCIAMLALAAIGMGLTSFVVPVSLRTAALQKVAANFEPVIAALTRYEADFRQPPPTLDALVPGYLASVPRAALGSCGELWYAAGRISFECPNGWLSLDRFVYDPATPCPTTRNYITVGRWCYFFD